MSVQPPTVASVLSIRVAVDCEPQTLTSEPICFISSSMCFGFLELDFHNNTEMIDSEPLLYYKLIRLHYRCLIKSCFLACFCWLCIKESIGCFIGSSESVHFMYIYFCRTLYRLCSLFEMVWRKHNKWLRCPNHSSVAFLSDISFGVDSHAVWHISRC